jgi:hypothetical protein
MPHEVARFEYRVFAHDLGIVEHRMHRLGGPPDIHDSAELYLASAPNDLHNVKIRDRTRAQPGIRALLKDDPGT